MFMKGGPVILARCWRYPEWAMRIRSLFVSLFLLLIAISFGHTYRSDGGTVLINEQPVFTLKSSLDGYTPSERAFMIVNTLTDGAIKLPLTIRAARTGTWLYAGSTRVVRITPAEAKAQGAATTELLRKWKQSIEAAYALPPIKASETTTSLGVGATTMVSLVGTEAQEVTQNVGNTEIAQIERVMGGLRVVGKAVGETTVVIHTPSSHIQLLVKVLPSAVEKVPDLMVEVHGDPAKAAEVQAVVADAIMSGLKTAKDARIEIISALGRRIPAGSTVTIPVKVRVLAPNTIPYTGTVPVKVKNLGVPKEKKVDRSG